VVAIVGIVAGLAVVAGLMIWAPWESAVPATPDAVREQARTSTSVLVQWAPSTTGPAVDHYLILRDGTEIGSVPGTVTSYRDTGLSPATVYESRVVAVSGDVRSAPSSVLLVKTLLPPI
jgi:chitodextrinase